MTGELAIASGQRVHGQIGLARVHLITREPEQAAALIGQVLPLAGERAPGRVGRKLGDFYRETARWAAVPVVRDVREQLRPRVAVFDQPSAGSRRECVVRIGITGHSNLTVESAPLVAAALRAELAAHASDGVVGVSCLARGADQLFARAVLELGGVLEVVLPSVDYRKQKVKADNAAAFDELLGRATAVHTLPFEASNRESYLAASEHVLSTVELMMAVWDGQPADGRGGTGDVVECARALGLPVTVVWPAGAARE